MNEEILKEIYAVAIERAEKPYKEQVYDKICGSLLGSAIADALGWITEFLKSKEQLRKRYGVDKIKDFRSWKKKTGGRFYAYIDFINQGEYSDDTQLMLCTARSLKPDGTCDMEHFSKIELPLWLDYARGAGITVTAAAKAIQRKTAKWNSNFFRVKAGNEYIDYRAAGANGAAMRIAPIVLANIFDFERAYNEVWKNAIVTHGHPRAIIGALVYSKALHLAMTGEHQSLQDIASALQTFVKDLYIPFQEQGIKEWVEMWNYGQKEDFEAQFERTKQEMLTQLDFVVHSLNLPPEKVMFQLGCFERVTKGSGTSTVSAAIALFLRYRHNYEQAVIETINLIGADTDTIGLMVGGLAGAVGGYMVIPDRWAIRLQDFPYFLRVAKALNRISFRESKGMDLLPAPEYLPAEVPYILDQIRSGEVRRGQRVKHPLFGLGWVHSVSSGWIKKRGGAMITIAHVVFDMGQSCWFRIYSG